MVWNLGHLGFWKPSLRGSEKSLESNESLVFSGLGACKI